jgi:hypothetical protein
MLTGYFAKLHLDSGDTADLEALVPECGNQLEPMDGLLSKCANMKSNVPLGSVVAVGDGDGCASLQGRQVLL